MAIVVWVFGLDDVDVGLGHLELVGEPDPVGTEEVADVRDLEVGLVEGVELAVAGLPEEGDLALEVRRPRAALGHGRLGRDVVGQCEVEIADRRLRRVGSISARLLHESDPAHRLGVLVLDPHGERQPVLSEGVEPKAELVARLGDRHEVAAKFDEVRLALEDLDVAGLGDLGKVLLAFQGFLLLVVGHAKHPQSGFEKLVSLGEDAEPVD